jgi:hypothetical protein
MLHSVVIWAMVMMVEILCLWLRKVPIKIMVISQLLKVVIRSSRHVVVGVINALSFDTHNLY